MTWGNREPEEETQDTADCILQYREGFGRQRERKPLPKQTSANRRC